MLAIAVTSSGRVLVIGVQHDHDVGAGGQSLAIAGLLIASVTVVAIVLEDVKAETRGDFDGMVASCDRPPGCGYRRFQGVRQLWLRGFSPRYRRA